MVDLGNSFALSAAAQGLLAPYKVAAFDDIPAGQKDAGGLRYDDYGGYVSIGCDAKVVKVCPTTFADLLKPAYKGQVALNGDPTKSGSAFGGVFAAALANGGSLDDIQPGLDFFHKLKKNGNFNPVRVHPGHRREGRDADQHRLGLPQRRLRQRVRGQGPGLEGVGARRRPVRAVLQPGDQQVRAAPGRRPPVGGVPLQRRGPEPVAQGLLPPRPRCRP